MIYPREGTRDDPHAHPRLAIVPTTADDTDGLDVVDAPLPGFPQGVLAMMNSRRNVLLYLWDEVSEALRRWRRLNCVV